MTDRMPHPVRLSRREAVVIFVAATIWFLPGIWWGLPVDAPTHLQGLWGVDELGPYGAVNAINAILGGSNYLSPQYPLAQYFVDALFVWPYHLAVRLADNVGLPEQTESVAVMVLLHRLPSVLMAAGTVAASAAIARRFTGSRVGAWFVALAVATIGPLGYYARTSNVDSAALFWTMLALAIAAAALQEALTVRRAVLLGCCAAASVATKDQQYAYFLGLGLVVVAAHLRDARQGVSPRERWRAPLTGLAVATGAYLLLSGLVLMPHQFAVHLEFIRHGSSAGIPIELRRLIGTYFAYPPTLAGYGQVFAEAAGLVLAAVGIPLLVLAAIGIVASSRPASRWVALLGLPVVTLLLGVVVPVRFVLPRFLLPVDTVLCLFAGLGLIRLLASDRWRLLGMVTATLAGGWGVLRGADLAWQMHHDVREEAAQWLDANLQPGDTLAYFGARRKLPLLRRDITVVPGPYQYLPDEVYGPAGPATVTPPFIIVIPQLVSEGWHEWSLPAERFEALMHGSLGYQQVLAIQSPALFPRPRAVASSVNPPVRVFARRDMVGRLPGPLRIALPDPTAPGPP